MLKSRQAAYYPEIAVGAQAYQNMGSLSTDGSPYYNVNKPGGNILLTIKVPLFDGGARDSGTAIAQSEVAAAREKLDQVRDVAVQQVVSAYNDLKTSLAAYTAALALRDAARLHTTRRSMPTSRRRHVHRRRERTDFARSCRRGNGGRSRQRLHSRRSPRTCDGRSSVVIERIAAIARSSRVRVEQRPPSKGGRFRQAASRSSASGRSFPASCVPGDSIPEARP